MGDTWLNSLRFGVDHRAAPVNEAGQPVKRATGAKIFGRRKNVANIAQRRTRNVLACSIEPCPSSPIFVRILIFTVEATLPLLDKRTLCIIMAYEPKHCIGSHPAMP